MSICSASPGSPANTTLPVIEGLPAGPAAAGAGGAGAGAGAVAGFSAGIFVVGTEGDGDGALDGGVTFACGGPALPAALAKLRADGSPADAGCVAVGGAPCGRGSG